MSVTTVAKIVQHSAVNVAIILSSRPVHSPSGEYGAYKITAKAEKPSLWQECRNAWVHMSKQLLGIMSVTWFCRNTKAHDWGIEIILTHHIISLNILNKGNLLIHCDLSACMLWVVFRVNVFLVPTNVMLSLVPCKQCFTDNYASSLHRRQAKGLSGIQSYVELECYGRLFCNRAPGKTKQCLHG